MSKPMVSVIVITYNSENTVLETLDSVLKQGYDNIELIISDDGSGDGTVSICKKWLKQNKTAFSNTIMLTTPENTGISANCNRGWRSSGGDWIKLIAGDDILKANCIETYIDFANVNREAKIITTQFQEFQDIDSEPRRFYNIHPQKKYDRFFRSSAQKQYKWLLTNSFNIAPSTMISREVLEKINGFDEEFPFFEDLPAWLKAAKAGYKIHYLDRVTVLYRLHNESIRIAEGNSFYNAKFYSSMFLFRKKYVYPYVPFYNFYFWQSEWARNTQYKVIQSLFSNRKTITSLIVYYVFLFLNISYLHRKLAKLFLPNTGFISSKTIKKKLS